MTSLVLTVLSCFAVAANGDGSVRSESVLVPGGKLMLRAELWRPAGPGPFPGVVFNHGSARASATPAGRQDRRNRLKEPGILGPIFARHGYVFLYFYRRGEGLSPGRGSSSGDRMASALASRGQEGRNQIQLQLLETDEMGDAMSGLAFLRALTEVDPQRVAAVGHSFGGSLTLLMAERDPMLRTVVVFSGAGGSWSGSPPLQARLRNAVGSIRVPVFFIHAANDYSTAPGRELGDEMARLHKPYRVKIYPPVGATADDGHRFVVLGTPTWESEVFAFLDEYTK